MPRLTVILPAKDAEDSLPQAAASVLRALPPDSELLIMDDGSRTPVAALPDMPVDRRIRILRNENPVGVGPASQMLLDASDSELVARMDADDITFAWRFRHQLPLLPETADFVFSPIVRFGDQVKFLRPGAPFPISAEAMPLHLLVLSVVIHPTMTALRSAINESGGYRDVPAEDYDLWLRATARGKRLVRTQLPVLGYRRHSRQLSFQANFAHSALSDPLLRSAYEALVRERFGVTATWLDVLWSGRSGEPDVTEGLEPLRELIDAQAQSLDWFQRFVLARTRRLLDQRMSIR